MLRVFATFLFCTVALGESAAAEVPENVVRSEILTGWRGDDGVHRAALKIDLAAGWKTYWRAAGEGGIPPRFIWDGSNNLNGVDVHYPVPRIFDQNGMRSFGYETQVVLPFHARAKRSGDIHLFGEVELGVCLDICIPVTLDIDAVLPETGVAHRDIITSAFADRPLTDDEVGVDGMRCEISPLVDGLQVTTRMRLPEGFRMAAGVMEVAQPGVWVSAATITQNGREVTAVADLVPPQAQPFLLARDDLRFTALGSDAAIELNGCD